MATVLPRFEDAALTSRARTLRKRQCLRSESAANSADFNGSVGLRLRSCASLCICVRPTRDSPIEGQHPYRYCRRQIPHALADFFSSGDTLQTARSVEASHSMRHFWSATSINRCRRSRQSGAEPARSPPRSTEDNASDCQCRQPGTFTSSNDPARYLDQLHPDPKPLPHCITNPSLCLDFLPRRTFRFTTDLGLSCPHRQHSHRDR